MAAPGCNAQQHLQLLAQLAIIFGGRCARCGSDDFATFEFHHKRGGGSEYRKTHQEVTWLRRLLDECKELNAPKEDIELICAACHAKELSEAVRAIRLTAKRTCTVLGNISYDELCQLVREGKIQGERVTKGKSRDDYLFTVPRLLQPCKSEC